MNCDRFCPITIVCAKFISVARFRFRVSYNHNRTFLRPPLAGKARRDKGAKNKPTPLVLSLSKPVLPACLRQWLRTGFDRLRATGVLATISFCALIPLRLACHRQAKSPHPKTRANLLCIFAAKGLTTVTPRHAKPSCISSESSRLHPASAATLRIRASQNCS
jgi:hypothetical protein